MNWFKSSYSGANGCVEVTFDTGQVLLRDSNDRGTIVVVSAYDWAKFIAGAKTGEFDLEAVAP